MIDIENEFYLGLNDTNKEEKFKILFENSINNSRQFNGFIADKKDGQCDISFSDKIDTESNTINFNQTLSEFIEEQKDNSVIDLSFIYFKDEIKEAFFDSITEKEILFANCIFQKKVYFTNSIFKEKVNFEGTEFKERTNFNRTKFSKECIFESVEFEKEVEFKETKFEGDAMFSSSRFENFSSFDEAIFSKEIDFENTIAKDLFYFHNVKLGKINLIGSHLDKANFLRLKNSDDNSRVLTKDNFSNKDSARIIKTHFEKENNITEANIYFILEQEFFLDLLSKENSAYPNKTIGKVSLLFNKYVSNYGTDWARVLIVLFSFGFIASYIYTLFDIQFPKDVSFNENENKLLVCGIFFSTIVYYLYYKNQKIHKLLLFIFVMYYIQGMVAYDMLQTTTNKITTLINPLNIFKQDKEYFKDIVLYGILVKAIVSTLIYQFVISFRNSTRRK